MVSIGPIYSSLVTANANLTTATANNALITWDTPTTLRHAQLTGTGTTFQVDRPGTYEVVVKFGGGQQESNMDYVITVSGTESTNLAYSGEALVARVQLAAADTVGVKNKSGDAIVPTAGSISWLTITPV